MDGISVYKVVKGVIVVLCVRVGDSVGWGVDSAVGGGADISDGVTFGINDESNMDFLVDPLMDRIMTNLWSHW